MYFCTGFFSNISDTVMTSVRWLSVILLQTQWLTVERSQVRAQSDPQLQLHGRSWESRPLGEEQLVTHRSTEAEERDGRSTGEHTWAHVEVHMILPYRTWLVTSLYRVPGSGNITKTAFNLWQVTMVWITVIWKVPHRDHRLCQLWTPDGKYRTFGKSLCT
jgi:hypothetical protein